MKHLILSLTLILASSMTFAAEQEYKYQLITCESANYKIDMIMQSEALAGVVRITENTLKPNGESDEQVVRAFRASGMGDQSRLVISREAGALKNDSKVLSLMFTTADYLTKNEFPVEMAQATLKDVLDVYSGAAQYEAGKCVVLTVPSVVE